MVSTAQSAGKRSRAKRKPAGSKGTSLLIIIAGILSIPFGLWGAGILALSGPTAMAMLYPFVALVKLASPHIPGINATPLAQWLMYLQFPLYGIFMARIYRYRGFWIALNAVIWLHILAWLLAAILMHVQNPYLGF